jgi:transposase
MSVCIMDRDGEIMVHRHLKASPEALLKVLAPDRDDLALAVECLFTWYWLADLCAQEGSTFVLGHARSRQAIPGGKATHDTIDAHKIAALLRGGRRPQASVAPAARRATRDLLRRRRPLMRRRSALLAPIQNTTSPYHLPEMGKKRAYQANRAGVAERFPDPAVRKSVAVDLALSGHDDQRLRDGELSVLQTATLHAANTLYLRRTVPGIGELLSLVLRSEIHRRQRFPRVQAVVSDCRLVKCPKASAGKRDGTSGTKIGHASLTWACSEAAV